MFRDSAEAFLIVGLGVLGDEDRLAIGINSR